jgi:hypothetical protein
MAKKKALSVRRDDSKDLGERLMELAKDIQEAADKLQNGPTNQKNVEKFISEELKSSTWP